MMEKSESKELEQASKGIERRELLKILWLGLSALLLLELAGAFISSFWPKSKAGAFGGNINAGKRQDIKALPVGTVKYYNGGHFYLSRVDGGILAIYRNCTHLGCVVPWLPGENSEDVLAGKGRFNCPCHSSIFDRYGLVHAGPAPRPLDLFKVIVEGNQVIVDTGKIISRSTFDKSQVTEL